MSIPVKVTYPSFTFTAIICPSSSCSLSIDLNGTKSNNKNVDQSFIVELISSSPIGNETLNDIDIIITNEKPFDNKKKLIL